MAEFCDTRLITQCAGYANNAYEPGLIEGYYIENIEMDCQVFVALNDEDEIIITGQGTTSMKDWLIDLKIWRTKVSYLNNTLVHAGFIKHYESVRSDIHVEIERLIKKKKIKKIICTRHSLFGAVATVIALDCAIIYDIPVSCVTFGSPRVGGPKFVALFDKLVSTSFRCVRHKDPITFTPLPIRFKHVRGGVHFGTKLTFNMPFMYDCCGCQVFHHSMEHYLKFIKNVHEEKMSNFFNKVTAAIGNMVSDVSDALPSLGFTEQENIETENIDIKNVEKENIEKDDTEVCKVCDECKVCAVCDDCYILHHNNKIYTRASELDVDIFRRQPRTLGHRFPKKHTF